MTPGIVGESDLSGNLTDEYVFFDGERVARKSTNGIFYYFSDHLKTASVITDASGTIKAESDYYPWGGELQFVANDSNHYKFTGKERDSETQLDYFGARYYSNGLGRWVSADWSPMPIPVPYADFNNPQSLNLYGFVGGNPASKADPDGHCWPLGQCAHIVMDSVNKAAASLDETAKNLKSPALAATLSFTSGATRDVVNGVVGLGTVGEASGTAWDSGNTTQRALAAVEDGGKVGGIILTVVALTGAKAPASADSGAQVAGDIGKNRVTLDNGSQVDLAGKAHFEKSTGTSVPTPHIKDPVTNTNPTTGQTFQNGYSATRGATIGDVNAAATAAGAKPPVTIPTPLPVPVPQKEKR
jgi:RHS repeat-associated protein